MNDLWRCPKCGHSFRWHNQAHSCVRMTVDDHLHAKPDSVVALYRDLEAAILSLGPGVEIHPVKTYISFQARMRFAGVEVQRKGLRCRVILPRVIDHPRILRTESPLPTQHVNRFRIDAPEDLDETVRGWLAEAYAFGSA